MASSLQRDEQAQRTQPEAYIMCSRGLIRESWSCGGRTGGRRDQRGVRGSSKIALHFNAA